MLICNRKELLREIDNAVKSKPNTIKFFCANFNRSHLPLLIDSAKMSLYQKIINKLFNASSDNIPIEILSKNVLNEENILKQMPIAHSKEQYITRYSMKYNESNPINLKAYKYFPQDSKTKKPSQKDTKEGFLLLKSFNTNNPMLDFINRFQEKENDESKKDRKAELEEFYKSLDTLEDELIKALNHINESSIFDEALKNSIKQELQNTFKDIKKYIKEVEQYRVKTAIRLLFSFLLNFYHNAFGGMYFLSAKYKTIYEYAFKNAILKFLATKGGLYSYILNTRLLSDILVFEYKDKDMIKIIDVSGFYLDYYETNLPLFQESGFVLDMPFTQAIEEYLLAFMQDKNQSLNLLNPRKISKEYAYDIYATRGDEKAILTPVNVLIDKTKKLNHIAYIETPFFNSAKLAKLFTDKNQQFKKEKGGTTRMNKNYLIIANCPTKYNAKLNEEIIQNIATNSIDRGDSSRKPHFNKITNTYETARDFSDYKINIADDKKPYILSLSPFIAICKDDIVEPPLLYRIQKKINSGIYAIFNQIEKIFPSTSNFFATSKAIDATVLDNELETQFFKQFKSYQHIKTFFKKESENFSNIAKQEREIAELYLQTFKAYIEKAILEQRQCLFSSSAQADCDCLGIFLVSYGIYFFRYNFLWAKIEFVSSPHPQLKYNNTEINIYCTNKQAICIIEAIIKENIPYTKASEQSVILQDVKAAMQNEIHNAKNSNADGVNAYFAELEQEILQSNEYKIYIENLKQESSIYFLSYLVANFLLQIFPLFKTFINDAWQQQIGNFLDFFLCYMPSFKDELSLIYNEICFQNINKACAEKSDLLEYLNCINQEKSYTDMIQECASVQSYIAKIAILTEQDKLDFDDMQRFKDQILQRDTKQGKIKLYHKAIFENLEHFQIYTDKTMPLDAESILKDHISSIRTKQIAGVLLIVFDILFPNIIKAQKDECEKIMHLKYSYFYDVPLAVKRDDKIYYPLLIKNNILTFDLQTLIYGSRLCTGGLTHHCALMYALQQRKTNILQELILERLLKFLTIDEKRGAKSIEYVEQDKQKQIQDKEFFNNDFKISLDNILKYKLDKRSALFKEFRRKEKDGGIMEDEDSPIHCYNKALEILYDYKDYYFTNTRKLDEKGKVIGIKKANNKARELMKCLDKIGNNNIKALYVGINDEDKPSDLALSANAKSDDNQAKSQKKVRPKFIGRLATTIIIEDGLWLG